MWYHKLLAFLKLNGLQLDCMHLPKTDVMDFIFASVILMQSSRTRSIQTFGVDVLNIGQCSVIMYIEPCTLGPGGG